MIEPMHGAEFTMRWDGVRWQIRVHKFVFNNINGHEQLGQELSALVLKAFEDNLAEGRAANRARIERNAIADAQAVYGPIKFNINEWHGPVEIKKVKFKGNK